MSRRHSYYHQGDGMSEADGLQGGRGFFNGEKRYGDGSHSEFKQYRKAQAKQGRTHSTGGTILRSIFCFLICAIIMAICIIITVLIYLKPPSITLGPLPTPGVQDIHLTGGSLNVSLPYTFSVYNPNNMGVKFKNVTLNLIYTGSGSDTSGTSVGGGHMDLIDFAPHNNKTITFPMAINYTIENDHNLGLIRGFASQCGLSIPGVSSSSTNSKRSDIPLDLVKRAGNDLPFKYVLNFGISVLSIHTNRQLSGQLSINCPLTQDMVDQIIHDAGVDSTSEIATAIGKVLDSSLTLSRRYIEDILNLAPPVTTTRAPLEL